MILLLFFSGCEMNVRRGFEIYHQLLNRLYADVAPTIYAMNSFSHMNGNMAEHISNAIDVLIKPYRRKYGLSNHYDSTGVYGALSDERVNFIKTGPGGTTVNDVQERISDAIRAGGFYGDRDVLTWVAGESFYEPIRYSSVSQVFTAHSVLAALREQAKSAAWDISLLPIIHITPRDTSDINLVTTNTIVFSSIGSFITVTLFGNNPDEVYSFVDKNGRIEPIPNHAIFDCSELQRARERRFEIITGDDHNAIWCNLLAAYAPGYTMAGHNDIPKYQEEYSLVNAAGIPFGEAIRLAIGVEHSIDVVYASSAKHNVADIAKEAIDVWSAGKYITSSDTVQPGLARTGSIVYNSNLLKEVVVLSFNLKLTKEQ